jgi:hypothetical protein
VTNVEQQLKSGLQSSLRNTDRWILLIEDGSNLAHCNCIKVNVPRFLEKYEFDTQKNQLDRVAKYFMKNTQEDFEKQSMLEMLDYATIQI